MTNEQKWANEQTCHGEGSDPDTKRLARNLDNLAAGLPLGAGGLLRWLNRESSRWIRIAVGALLIVGGIFGFLPILGFWMLPLGGLLLAMDIAVLRKPMLWLLTNAKWQLRKLRRLKRNGLDLGGGDDAAGGRRNGGNASPVKRQDA